MSRKCPVGFRKVRSKCVRVQGSVGNVPASAALIAASVPLGIPGVPFAGLGARLENKTVKPAEVYLIIRAQGTNRIAAINVGGSTVAIGGPIQPGEKPEVALTRYAEFGGWNIKGTLKYVVVQRQRFEEELGPKGELIPAAAGLAVIKTWYVIKDGEASMRASWEGKQHDINPTTIAVEDLWRIGGGNENASVLKVADDLAREYALKAARKQAEQRGEQTLPFIPPPSIYTVEPESSYVIPEVESARDAAYDVDVPGREEREPEESETSDIYSMTPELLLMRGGVARGDIIKPRIYTKEQVAAERAEAERRQAEADAAEAARKDTRAAAKRKMLRATKAAEAPKPEAPAEGTLRSYADYLVYPVDERADGSGYGYAPHVSDSELVFVVDEPELMPLVMKAGKGKPFNRFKVDPKRRMVFYVREGKKPSVGLRGLGAEEKYTVARKPMVVASAKATNLLARAMGPQKVDPGIKVVRRGQEVEAAAPPSAPVVIESGAIAPVPALAPAVVSAPSIPAPVYESSAVKAAYGERERQKVRRTMSEDDLASFMVGSDVLGETTITRYYKTTSTALYPAKFIGTVKGHLVQFQRSHEMTLSVNGVPTQVYVYIAPRPDIVRAVVASRGLMPAATVTAPTEVRPQGVNYFPPPSDDARELNRATIEDFLADEDVNDAGTFVPDLRATWARGPGVSSFRVNPQALAAGAITFTYPGRPSALLFIGHDFSADKKALPLVFRHFAFKRELRFEGRLQDGTAIEGFVPTETVRALNPNRPMLPVQWHKRGQKDFQEGFIKLDYATVSALRAWMGKLANAQLGKLNGLGAASKSIRFKRIAPGFYEGTYNGHKVEVSQVPSGSWVWLVDGEGGHDWFESKREAVEALETWLSGR